MVCILIYGFYSTGANGSAVYQIDGAVSHLNDVIVLLPVFFEGRLIGFTANFGHMT